MKILRKLLPLVLLVVLASVAPGAEADNPDAGIKLLRDHGGDLVLAISQPWRIYSRPSIEVCLLPNDFPETTKIHPLHFVNEQFKGNVTEKIYHTLDRADQVPVQTPFTVNEIPFKAFGKRNSLGKPAVCVACRTKSPVAVTPPEPAKAPLPRAVFCLLEHWAGEEDNLYLNLPADYFAAPGKLRIWLMRDQTAVWSTTIAWPGLPGHQTAAPKEESAPAKSAKPKATTAKKPAKSAPPKEEAEQ